MSYSYEIATNPAGLGGGWRLSLLKDGLKVGGEVFPVQIDPNQGVTWWNAMTEDERVHWIKVAHSARSVDAYEAFLIADAFTAAMNEACAWIATRES
jgi:hypothetical protein